MPPIRPASLAEIDRIRAEYVRRTNEIAVPIYTCGPRRCAINEYKTNPYHDNSGRAWGKANWYSELLVQRDGPVWRPDTRTQNHAGRPQAVLSGRTRDCGAPSEYRPT